MKRTILGALTALTLTACGNNNGDGTQDAQTAGDLIAATTFGAVFLALVP